MKILVIGGGGREHAIIWKIRQSPLAEKIYCAPGNAGIAALAECVDIGVHAFDRLIAFAKEKQIDFTIIGPDDPLAAGIADAFSDAGLLVFGPKKNAAMLEASKAFAKDLMKKYNIPTAAYENFSDYPAALAYIQKSAMPLVIKADGLALGKGVLICNNRAEAEKALAEMFIDKKFGASGQTVVIEEFLTGPEVSVLAFCDGKTVVPMVSAQDHKRAFDGDKGLNTGGMGTFSPSRVYTAAIQAECMEKIFQPTVAALNSEGIVFQGIIFFGLMLTENGARVIEYNARFGDPEAQVVLPRLESDLVEILLACAKGRLAETEITWSAGGCACVVLASGGYPEGYDKGYAITGIAAAEKDCGVTVFHAGTALKDNQTVTNGGRVLGVTASAESLDAAIKKAYEGVAKIHFDKMQFRTDIGIK